MLLDFTSIYYTLIFAAGEALLDKLLAE